MKRIKLVSFMAFLLCLVTGCSNAISNEKQSKNDLVSASNEQVIITFIQHTFVDEYTNEETDLTEYVFKNDALITSEKEYEKGHYLTKEEIDRFPGREAEYIQPKLNGDGYFRFTYFATEFSEETGVVKNKLKPLYLNENMTVHFAVHE